MKELKFPKRYVIIVLTFFCTNVFYIERMGFSIAYTAAADAIGISQSEKGMILSMFYYGYVLSQIPGGWAAQRFGGRLILLWSFFAWSSICALVPLDPNRVIMLAISRLLIGMGQGFIFPSVHTILAQWVPPHERSRSVSITTSGMYLGAAAAMLLVPGLVRLRGPQSVCFVEAGLALTWCIFWSKFASEPNATVMQLPITKSRAKVPWKKIMLSLPVWAILANNFTFHYALYVLMSWLPTYFELGLHLSLQEMGPSKMLPYLNMFIFSNLGGVFADRLIAKRILSVTRTRKLLNTVGFVISALALFCMPLFKSSAGALLCSSVSLGFLALGRAGFAVNHLDIAPGYAGIVMAVSNMAGNLAGIIGVGLTGRILEIAKATHMDLSSAETWKPVFFIPAYLCILSCFIFLVFAKGDRIFE